MTGYNYQTEWAFKVRTGMWPDEYATQLTAGSTVKIRSEETTTDQVKVGDRITEESTPDGPFYPVTKILARSIVVDARETGDPEPLPLPFPRSPRLVVRVAL